MLNGTDSEPSIEDHLGGAPALTVESALAISPGGEVAIGELAPAPVAAVDITTAVETAVEVAAARRAHVAAALKRAIDVIGALVLLLALLPIVVVVTVAIVLESPGPVLYRAPRVGRGGRLMAMYKFRKMNDGASGMRLTLGEDPRFTRIGAFLAKTKLDELPQLWNVLRGDMSLIGPRPEDPGFARRQWHEYEEILTVRPGITGLSQLAFAAESRILSPDDPERHYLERIMPQKMALDVMYVREWTLRMDVAILLWTFVAIFFRRQVAVDRSTGRLCLRRRPGRSRERLA